MSRLVDLLMQYYLSEPDVRGSIIVSPFNNMFMKHMDRYVPGVHRAWDRATLKLDGADSDSYEKCKRQLDVSIAKTKEYKKQKLDAPVHDAANIALKLLKFSRWCLDHDGNSTIHFTFPRSHHRLYVLNSALKFLIQTEGPKERETLKKALGADRIAPVRISSPHSSAVVFQTPSEFLLLNFYGVTRWDKKDVTGKELFEILKNENFGYTSHT